MGTVSTYILMITLLALEGYAFYKKEYTLKFTGVIALVYIFMMVMMFFSTVNYFVILVYLMQTIMLNIILFISIVARFQTEEEDDE